MTSGIIEILKENAGVQALVGENAAAGKYKVYPVVAPQGESIPYITVFKGLNDPLSSLTKDLESMLDYPRVTVTCWHKNFRPTEEMFEAVREALDNQGFTDAAGYDFERVWLIDDRDGFDPQSNLYCHVAVFGVEQKRP